MRTRQKCKDWILLKELKYDVNGPGGQVLLKAGTKNVKVRFRCGRFLYTAPDGVVRRVNEYMDSAGNTYQGW